MRSALWLLPLALVASACSLLEKDEGDPPDAMLMPTPFEPERPLLDMGPVKHASRPLPAISGGTLAVGELKGAEIAVASDPEHDRIWLIDPKKSAPLPAIQLEEGAEPGRVAIHGGRAFVALRRAGDLAVVDLAQNKIEARLGLCATPRGLDVDHEADLLAMTCASGELILLRASTLEPQARYQLDRDLRDVVIRGEEILVSRFRSSELIVVLKDGSVRDRTLPPDQLPLQSVLPSGQPARPETASVAWRMVPTPSGGAVVLHQIGNPNEVQITQPGGYGSSGAGCGGSIVRPAVSVIGSNQVATTGFSEGLVVDVAVDEKTGQVAMALASTPAPGTDFNPGGSERPAAPDCAGVGVGAPSAPRAIVFDGIGAPERPAADPTTATVVGAVAVAFSPSGALVQQRRAPHGVTWGGKVFAFGGDAEVEDTGHAIFHMNAGSGLSCASCHPEGGDDGRTWTFEKLGKRRTQPLAGGLKGSEPFHWSGDMGDFSVLVTEVFGHRMGGPRTNPEQSGAVLDWVHTIPTPPSPRTSGDEVVARGRQLFESAEVGCVSCHQGTRLATNDTVDVGTGEPMQVPTLRGLAYRAPYMHDGCATTLKDRFGACGGGDRHGKTSQLSQEQLADLIAYLETL